MSKKEKEVSDRELDEQQKSFVYDFLYCDSQRIGSFLSQFDDAGHLQQVIERENVATDVRRGFKVSVGGGATILGTGGQGSIGLEKGPGTSGSEGSDRVYNPIWANALTLLDFLEERRLIKRRVEDAAIGNFILISGQLIFVDLAVLQQAWSNTHIRKVMMAGANEFLPGNRKDRRRSSIGVNPNGSVIDLMLALLSILPHTLQGRVFGDDHNAWFTLSEESLLSKSSDLLLKHGSHIQGTWSVLGILDAHPSLINPLSEEGKPLAEMLADVVETQVAQLAVRMGPVSRQMLGRPEGAHGITPLLIFREVSS